MQRTEETKRKISLYPSIQVLQMIEESYQRYIEHLDSVQELVRPVSKSIWIINLLERELAEAPGGSIR